MSAAWSVEKVKSHVYDCKHKRKSQVVAWKTPANHYDVEAEFNKHFKECVTEVSYGDSEHGSLSS